MILFLGVLLIVAIGCLAMDLYFAPHEFRCQRCGATSGPQPWRWMCRWWARRHDKEGCKDA